MGAIAARVHYSLPTASEVVRDAIRQCLGTGSGIRVVCIGSDRSTGDALGPLVGSYLLEQAVPMEVFGTLEEPLHAENLLHWLPRLVRPGCRIIAVDAALGRSEHVGSIFITEGPLTPGLGVAKTLPAVGDVAVTATVNVAGFMEAFVLQSTRLFLVQQMAAVIARGIAGVLEGEGLRYNSNVSSSRVTSSAGVMPSTLMTGVSRKTVSSPNTSSSSPLITTASTSSSRSSASDSGMTSKPASSSASWKGVKSSSIATRRKGVTSER